MRKFFIFQLFRGAASGLVLPYYILYIISQKSISLFDLGILLASYEITMVLLEIPTGRLTDRVGLKKPIITSSLFILLSWVIFVNSHYFIEFLIFNILWAIGDTFLSGAEEKWLSLLSNDNNFTKNLLRANQINLVFMVFGSIVGGFFTVSLVNFLSLLQVYFLL